MVQEYIRTDTMRTAHGTILENAQQASGMPPKAQPAIRTAKSGESPKGCLDFPEIPKVRLKLKDSGSCRESAKGLH